MADAVRHTMSNGQHDSLWKQIVRPFREMSVIDNVALAAGLDKTASPLKALFHRRRTHRHFPAPGAEKSYE